jgi:hypothetical protein
MNLLTDYRPGTYWKRKQVNPCRVVGKSSRLHTNMEVGTFVRINPKYFDEKDAIRYHLVDKPQHFGVLLSKVFGIYFERVVTMSELGLIKLIEQPDS